MGDRGLATLATLTKSTGRKKVIRIFNPREKCGAQDFAARGKILIILIHSGVCSGESLLFSFILAFPSLRPPVSIRIIKLAVWGASAMLERSRPANVRQTALRRARDRAYRHRLRMLSPSANLLIAMPFNVVAEHRKQGARTDQTWLQRNLVWIVLGPTPVNLAGPGASPPSLGSDDFIVPFGRALHAMICTTARKRKWLSWLRAYCVRAPNLGHADHGRCWGDLRLMAGTPGATENHDRFVDVGLSQLPAASNRLAVASDKEGGRPKTSRGPLVSRRP